MAGSRKHLSLSLSLTRSGSVSRAIAIKHFLVYMLMSRSTKCPSSAREYLSTAQDRRVSFRLLRASRFDGAYGTPRDREKEREREKDSRRPSSGKTPPGDESGSLESQRTSDGQRIPKINVGRTTKRNESPMNILNLLRVPGYCARNSRRLVADWTCSLHAPLNSDCE